MMNSNKSLVIAGIVVAILVILAFFAGRTAPSSQVQLQNSQVSSSTAAMATTTTATSSTPRISGTVHVPPASYVPPGAPGAGNTLHVGQSVTTASGYTITIVSLTDNRCPIGLTCTSAGTVSANVKIQMGSFVRSQIFTIGVPTTEYGFTAELVGASPQRKEGQTIPQSAYALFFTVK